MHLHLFLDDGRQFPSRFLLKSHPMEMKNSAKYWSRNRSWGEWFGEEDAYMQDGDMVAYHSGLTYDHSCSMIQQYTLPNFCRYKK